MGEREFAALLREHGFDARRGQQFAGGADSPDVVSDALAWLHVEVKRVQNLNLADACVQAEGDCRRQAVDCGAPPQSRALADHDARRNFFQFPSWRVAAGEQTNRATKANRAINV